MTPSDANLQESLLIVDDRVEVLRGLERFLSLYFRQVLVATTPAEAEALLSRYHPEHLLCDYRLRLDVGQAEALATDLIPGWRQKHPSLRKVALMTGGGAKAVVACDAVDEIFQKPLDVTSVIEFFSC